jgi:hypothetical protein
MDIHELELGVVHFLDLVDEIGAVKRKDVR